MLFYPIWFVPAYQICVSLLLYCSWHLWEPGTYFVACVVCQKAQKMAIFGLKMAQNSQKLPKNLISWARVAVFSQSWLFLAIYGSVYQF